MKIHFEHIFLLVCGVALLVVVFTKIDNASARYQVGDCLTFDYEFEDWQKPAHIFKVQEVGKSHYRTRLWIGDHWGTQDDSDAFNLSYKQVPCPEEH